MDQPSLLAFNTDRWLEDGMLWSQPPLGRAVTLAEAVPGLRLERIAHADATMLAVLLRRE